MCLGMMDCKGHKNTLVEFLSKFVTPESYLETISKEPDQGTTYKATGLYAEISRSRKKKEVGETSKQRRLKGHDY